jgi:hypothetical protein
VSRLFLTAQELEDMTGLVQPAAQVRWLQKNQVEHYLRADGKVRVPVSEIGRGRLASRPVAPIGPDLDAVRVRH